MPRFLIFSMPSSRRCGARKYIRKILGEAPSPQNFSRGEVTSEIGEAWEEGCGSVVFDRAGWNFFHSRSEVSVIGTFVLGCKS